jgi:hypothetical protein
MIMPQIAAVHPHREMQALVCRVSVTFSLLIAI